METQAQVVGMPITFNGVNINQWFIATDVQRGLGTNHSNQLTKIGKTDGKYFQYMTRDTLTIAVTGYIRDDDDNTGIAAARRLLAQALDSDDLEQLIFGDEPDKYYLAILDGQSSIAETGYNGTVTMNFIVPDGVAHATTARTFTALDADGMIEVKNAGSYPAFPVIEATMKSDNGVVAFASDSGAALQFGNPQEVDGYIADNSEKVLQIGYEKDPGIGVLNAGAISDYPNYNNNVSQPLKIQGTVDYADTRGNDPAGGSGIWPKYNNAKSDYWGGPTMYFPIHANSNKSKTGNFIMKTRFSFNTSVKQMGRLEIYLANGKTPEYGIVLRASTTINDLIICEFHAGGQYMDSFELNRNVFKNNRQKEVQITKLGSDITFSIGEVYQYIANDQVKTSGKVTKNYNLANMKDVPIDGYNLWFEEYSTIWPVQSDVTDTQFSWVNVDRWVDLPNRFDKGDVLTVDVQNRTIFLNGVENRTLQTIGNQWSDFLISPGLTKIEPVCSTWATMFDTKISLREAYV